MNLTNQQLLQVFMLYPNAKRIDNGGRERKSIIKVMESGDLITMGSITCCQLLLRSIDQLTEEEKRELAEVLEADSLGVNIEPTGIEFFISWGYYTASKDVSDLPYPAADYLRSINIALPYMGVDLFESGVAKRIKP